MTRSNASAGSPPCARGSVSGPMMSKNSRIEPGQPWVTISGRAFGSGERTCRKWTFWPSISVVNCGWALIRASVARQSYVVPPVVVERSDVRLLDAVVDVAGELVGPAGAVEPIAQVVEVGLRDVELERPDRGVGGGVHRSVLPLVLPFGTE